MHKQDDDLNTFFAEMRKTDEALNIPEFDGMKPAKKVAPIWYLIPAGVAASLLIILSIYFSLDQGLNPDIEDTFVIIDLGEPETHTEFLIKDDPSIYAWKPSSNTLINDFND